MGFRAFISTVVKRLLILTIIRRRVYLRQVYQNTLKKVA